MYQQGVNPSADIASGRIAEVRSRSMSCNCMTRTSQQECRSILEFVWFQYKESSENVYQSAWAIAQLPVATQYLCSGTVHFIRKNQAHPLPVVVKISPDQGIDFFETIDQRGRVHIHGFWGSSQVSFVSQIHVQRIGKFRMMFFVIVQQKLYFRMAEGPAGFTQITPTGQCMYAIGWCQQGWAIRQLVLNLF